MKLPYNLKENNKIIHKYLYPIMYKNAEGITVIYIDEYTDVINKLEEDAIAILENYIKMKKIPVVDEKLSKEEQLKYAREYINSIPKENSNPEFVEEISTPFGTYVKKENNQINEKMNLHITPIEIVEYLASDLKTYVNLAIYLDMPYYIEKLFVNDDKEKTLVLLDCIINNKTNYITATNRTTEFVTDSIKNAEVMGLDLETIASYYNSNIFNSTKKPFLNEQNIKIIRTLEEMYKLTTPKTIDIINSCKAKIDL